MNLEKVRILHETALALLEMARQADVRIATQRENIKRVEDYFFYTVKNCEERIESLSKAKVRVLRSYDRVLAEIFNATNV